MGPNIISLLIMESLNFSHSLNIYVLGYCQTSGGANYLQTEKILVAVNINTTDHSEKNQGPLNVEMDNVNIKGNSRVNRLLLAGSFSTRCDVR